MSPITTHVLDAARGRPAVGLGVVLAKKLADDRWEAIGRGETDGDGRVRALLSAETVLAPGVYRLVFDTGRYFAAHGEVAFYPEVIVVFAALAGEAHYHVPLLLGPFGYTTYRGS